MDRKDNVTDRLIEISGKLKKSGSVPAATEAEAAVPTYAILPEPVAAAEKKQDREDTARARRIADGERAKRDLAARIAKDQATLEVELGALESRLQLLREIEGRMNEQLRKLEDITPENSGVTFAKEIDDVRLDYFRTVGRREAAAPCESRTPASGEAARPAVSGTEQLKQGMRTMLLPSAAILAAALLIAGAIVAVFR